MAPRALQFVLAFAALSLVRGLLSRRQNTIPNLPSQCQSTCDPVNTDIGASVHVTEIRLTLIGRIAQWMYSTSLLQCNV